MRTVRRNFNFNIDWWLPYAYNLSSCMSQAIWIENIVWLYVCLLQFTCTWIVIMKKNTPMWNIFPKLNFFSRMSMLYNCLLDLHICLFCIASQLLRYIKLWFSCHHVRVVYQFPKYRFYLLYITVTVSILLNIVYAAKCILQIIFAM